MMAKVLLLFPRFSTFVFPIMAAQLPTELWWKILELLPLYEVSQVGQVNTVFLEIARELRYRDLKFVGYDEKTEHKLETMRSVIE